MAALATGCTIAAAWHPSSNGQVTCPFRLLTGHWCPGCGMTRAALALGRLDVGTAFRFHPWVFALAAQFVVFGVWRLRSSAARLVSDERVAQRLIWLNIGALIVVWLIRTATGAIPVV